MGGRDPAAVAEGEDTYDLSFVIPCLNEELNIGRTIHEIERHTPDGLTYEVIVADHGSSDRTRDVAEAAGAVVVRHPEVRLGELRNCGARVARGETLVFLDADISLTDEWRARIAEALARLGTAEPTVTGSRTEYAFADHWTSRGFGMQKSVTGDVRYLGTAHLIVRRSLFWQVGGFPPDRDSGEDEAFGARVRDFGARMVADPSLRAVHRGAPATARGFFVRQLWHGMGDAASWTVFRKSKTALAAAGFVAAHGLLVMSLVPVPGPWSTWTATTRVAGLAIVAGLPVAKAWSRRGGLAPGDVPAALVTFYLFYWARGLAPIVRMATGSGRRIGRRAIDGGREDE